MLLGRPSRDMDVTFSCSEEDFIQRNPEARKVRAKPLSIFILNNLEFTPLRGRTIQEDLASRDFTVNALALTHEGIIIAHKLGISDLRERQIRPAGPQSIAKDPIRAFRAARMAAQFSDFAVTGEAIAQMRALSPSALNKIAPEQVGKEMQKALASEKPGNFLRVLEEAGCLAPWFAELANANEIPAGPAQYHAHSVLGHIAEVMDKTAQAARTKGLADQERSLAVWMALCHDLGKTQTAIEDLPRHHGHDKRGVIPAAALGIRLSLSNRHIRAGEIAASEHMRAARYRQARPGTKVDLLEKLHKTSLLRPFFTMVETDSSQQGLLEEAELHLKIILSVSLPQSYRNIGEKSGRYLREMRCEALSRVG